MFKNTKLYHLKFKEIRKKKIKFAKIFNNYVFVFWFAQEIFGYK